MTGGGVSPFSEKFAIPIIETNPETGAPVIDAKTGRAYSFPVATGSAYSEKEVDYFQDHLYKLNSRLMVFAGNLVGSEEYTGENTVAFYEFKDNKFILIKTAPYK